MLNFGFTTTETRAVTGISSLYFLRIVGLFLLYPVLMVYASELPGSTPLLIGLALGIYGLAQAMLQIPFGHLSDKFGRKPLIAIGLLFFILGSLVAAISESMTGLILGRVLQGAGAISAVCTAMMGDLVAIERRSKAMACIGIVIGIAFSLSLILGPLLVVNLGLSGLFYVLAGLGGLALLVLRYAIPKSHVHADTQAPDAQRLRHVLTEWPVVRTALSIGILHTALAAMFMAAPLQIIELTGQPLEKHVLYYLVGILLTFLIVFPLLGLVERKQKHRVSILGAIAALALASLMLWLGGNHIIVFFTALALFFLAFNFLEASFPALMTRLAPVRFRGAAMGLYSTCQFLGIFLGGIVAGIVLNYSTATTLYFVLIWAMVLWLIIYNYKGGQHGQSRSQ